MNWFECLYCYTQYERIKEGQPILYSSQNGNFLLTFSLLILVYGTFFLLISFFPNLVSSLSDITKTIGEILVAVSIALFYPIISMTIGRQENFERITELFLKMSAEEQEKISKKGILFFSLSMFYFPFVGFLIYFLN